MTDTIDIPLDATLLAALRAGGRHVGGTVAGAVLALVGGRPAAGRLETVDAPAPPVVDEDERLEPIEAEPGAFEHAAAELAAPDDERMDLTAPAAPPPAWTVDPARTVPASDDAPAPRGDVYIANYYARLPGETAVNAYTRLGGFERHV